MFACFMVNAWTVATIVAVIAGVVGFFVVLRGAAFPAHAIPNGAFAGAAGASLIGVNALVGLGTFSVLAALGIGALGRRGRHDVVTALALVMMLALGALFLSQTTGYEPEIFSLLFGEVLGIASNEICRWPSSGALYLCGVRALSPSGHVICRARDRRGQGYQSHTLRWRSWSYSPSPPQMTVPVVGALLIFSLMIGPPAAARSFTDRPPVAITLSVAIALVTVWSAIAISFVYELADRLLRRGLERRFLWCGQGLGRPGGAHVSSSRPTSGFRPESGSVTRHRNVRAEPV